MNGIVSVLALGESGVGKSQAGCAFLQRNNAFETNSSPDSCTYETSAQSNNINGVTRYYIDTQGLASTDGMDADYIKQMIDFLKRWKYGINAIFIIINVQCPKFDSGIQKMIKMINDIFNEPNFWNQTGIIFTRCFPGFFNKATTEKKYRKIVIDFIQKLPGCQYIIPQMPCFFVDSVNWTNDILTKFEFTRIFEYAHKNKPVKTQKMRTVTPLYRSKQKKYIDDVVLKIRYCGQGANRTKIITYANQIQYKIVLWSGSIVYTDPETIEAWEEKIPSVVEQETMVEKEENKEEIFRWEKYGSRRFGICGPRKTRQVHDYYIITTKYIEYIRDVITDPDGEVEFGEWEYNREWTRKRRV